MKSFSTLLLPLFPDQAFSRCAQQIVASRTPHYFATLSSGHINALPGRLGSEQYDDDKANTSRARTLVLYSKKGCCLCDGLKEKLEAVLLMDGEGSLADLRLQVRDITTNRQWEEAYKYEIPVLSYIDDDNSERVLPRLSPRLTPESIKKRLLATLKR